MLTRSDASRELEARLLLPALTSLISCETMKEAYAVRRTAPPSAEIEAPIDELLAVRGWRAPAPDARFETAPAGDKPSAAPNGLLAGLSAVVRGRLLELSGADRVAGWERSAPSNAGAYLSRRCTTRPTR
jgi:hypothetical protein